MEERDRRAYARLIAEVCLGLGPGARLRIGGEPPHRELMLALAEAAYEGGAREVRLDWRDGRLAALQARLLGEDYLDEGSTPQARLGETYVEEGWFFFSFAGEESPRLLEGLEPGRLQRIERARSRANRRLFEAILSNRLTWSQAPGPTEAWAREVFEGAGLDPGPRPEERLWEALKPILRLDAADPAQALRAHFALLEERRGRLDSLGLREILFRGPGTELRVGLSPASRWIGGGSSTPEGHRFYPNLPTEEVFTAPDWRRVEGRATCTRPVTLFGLPVEGAWLEFRSGELVASGATRNAEALARFAESDPGARRLGELALVDGRGPIARSGLVFHNSLIDENAACHLALGSAYEECWEGAAGLSAEERLGAGFNESLVHEDLMIGSEEVEVLGYDEAGREIPLIGEGRFRI